MFCWHILKIKLSPDNLYKLTLPSVFSYVYSHNFEPTKGMFRLRVKTTSDPTFFAPMQHKYNFIMTI